MQHLILGLVLVLSCMFTSISCAHVDPKALTSDNVEIHVHPIPPTPVPNPKPVPSGPVDTTPSPVTPNPVPTPQVSSIPGLDKFNEIMIDNTANSSAGPGSYGGGYWCAQYANYPDPGKLFISGLTYYDAARVFYQIADYTKDPKWNACAKTAVIAYRDGYVNYQNPPSSNGYTLFPKGLYLDFIKTGDVKSKQAIIDLSQNASYAREVPTAWVPGPASIREFSYNLETRLYAGDVGSPIDYNFHLKRLQLYWAQTRWMLENQTGEGMPAILTPDPIKLGDKYVRPFMIGISAEALIEYQSRTNDGAVLPTIQPVLELMWQQAYDGKGAMYYTVPQKNGACPWGPAPTGDNSGPCTETQGDPTLNMLIAPAYMWVYNQTGDTKWRDRADALFQGTVTAFYKTGGLCCPAGKGFDQVFKWFPEYFKWRNR